MLHKNWTSVLFYFRLSSTLLGTEHIHPKHLGEDDVHGFMVYPEAIQATETVES